MIIYFLVLLRDTLQNQIHLQNFHGYFSSLEIFKNNMTHIETYCMQLDDHVTAQIYLLTDFWYYISIHSRNFIWEMRIGNTKIHILSYGFWS